MCVYEFVDFGNHHSSHVFHPNGPYTKLELIKKSYMTVGGEALK